jgi:hypothetical protein
MTTSDILLEFISHALFIPSKQAEKLLQVAGRHAEGVGHRLEALAGQRPQLSLDVQVEIPADSHPAEVPVELTQKTSQFRLELQNRLRIHTDDLPIETLFLLDHRIAA